MLSEGQPDLFDIFHSELVIYNVHVISLVDKVKKVISNSLIEAQS